MDIKSLHNNFIRSNDTDRVAREKGVSGSESKDKSATGSVRGDSLSLGEARFAGELDFAKSVMQNLKEQSFEQLRQIKGRIEDGFYTSDEFAGRLAESLAAPVETLDTIQSPEGYVSAAKPLSEERINTLMNDPEVLDRISSRLLDDISNL